MELLKAVRHRRSYYDIGKHIEISEAEIIDIVKTVTNHIPSAFNAQSSRVIILFKEDHDRLWDITLNNLKKIVAHDKFPRTESKINSFKSGYGTLLFFDETSITNALMEKYPKYKHNCIPWVEQSNGMLQHTIWMALEQVGLGASLQHYNEVIEEDIKKEWKIKESWRLIAQMPFGKVLSLPSDKKFTNIDERVIVMKNNS